MAALNVQYPLDVPLLLSFTMSTPENVALSVIKTLSPTSNHTHRPEFNPEDRSLLNSLVPLLLVTS